MWRKLHQVTQRTTSAETSDKKSNPSKKDAPTASALLKKECNENVKDGYARFVDPTMSAFENNDLSFNSIEARRVDPT